MAKGSFEIRLVSKVVTGEMWPNKELKVALLFIELVLFCHGAKAQESAAYLCRRRFGPAKVCKSEK